MKIFIKFLAVALILIQVTTACKKESVQGVNLDSSILYLFVDEKTTLTPSFVPPTAYNKKVIWESDDTNVASVENGKVTGKAMGKATITVITEDGGKKAKCIVYVLQPIEPKLVWVEGGTFTMGCTDDECIENELPSHEVTLSGFYIGKYVVTQKEWVATMGKNPSTFIIGDSFPVHRVNWDLIQEYIAKLNAYTGKNYRLPTEAEWEYAARGGNKTKGYKYSGSDFADNVAWYGNNCSILQPVGKKQPNELGIYDMSGNILEFCSDRYGKYPISPQINPTGYGTENSGHVLRGGCWTLSRFWVRNSYRGCGESYQDGFRLVLPEYN
jgi:formylglycine-generating enzyme required for sulfatase activity